MNGSVTPMDLGALPNSNDLSYAFAIADNGDVAGWSMDTNGQLVAVLWRARFAELHKEILRALLGFAPIE